ncbi:MAG: competence/damage-inducible protein A [Dehalococcoidia bacterium]|nr:competence/damage-inducible protein A [Dehalococcoidia bacterium]MDW8119863.1 competence/damage-inducible protein A [Chloroflexota bacterium]
MGATQTLAEILSIGTELLMGEIVDTNAAWLAARLPALGITLRWVTQVGDDMGDLTYALRQALGRSHVVLTTGGLGPTEDDLTREAIAQVLGEPLVVDESLLAHLQAYFQRRGVPMAQSNIKQAMRIPSATPLPNPRGTAPGWWVERDGRVIVCMPGVPHEMEHMWTHEVAPRLHQKARGTVILTRTIKTFGMPEGSVGEQVKEFFGKENPYLGIYAKPDGIHLRLIARAPTQAEAWALIAPVEEAIRQRLEPIIWGVDNDTPERQVGALLKEKGWTLAVMESCTGGLLASTITDVAGSSAYFRGGAVTYTAEAKVAHGVDRGLIEAHGVVSPQVAEGMARAARETFKADFGIGITGVAGPDPLEGKPPGTVFIGIAWEGGSRSLQGRHPPDRALVKRRAVMHALLELRRTLAQRIRG